MPAGESIPGHFSNFLLLGKHQKTKGLEGLGSKLEQWPELGK